MVFLQSLVVVAIAVWVSTLVPGIDVKAGSTAGTVATLLCVAAILAVVETALKPYVRTLAYPLYAATNGLFALVANALLYWLTSWLAGAAHLPFHIAGFWPALWGALMVSIVVVEVKRSLRT